MASTIQAVPHCPDCGGTGYVPIDIDEVEPCSCIAPDVRNAMTMLVIELECEGIADPLAERFTLGAILDDLSRLLGIQPPAHVANMMTA